MSRPPAPAVGEIMPDMTVLDVISLHRSTEAVFKAYEAETGHCICCEALFDPLHQVARRYGLNLSSMLTRLKEAAACMKP
jgi:hypothetical protein